MYLRRAVEGCCRIWVLTSNFASLQLLSRWRSFTINWDKRFLVSLDFLIVPVLLSVLCSLMALLLRLQWLLTFHVPVLFSVSFPTSWENSFPAFDTGFAQLTNGGGMLLTLLTSSIPSEWLAKFILTSEKPKISTWIYLMIKRNFLKSWKSRMATHYHFFQRYKTDIKAESYEHVMQSKVTFCICWNLLGRKQQAELFRIFFFFNI